MLLLLLLGVFLLWTLSKFFYIKYWSEGLSVSVEFQDLSIYEGESSSMKETVINDKYLPLPAIEVRLATNRNLKFLKDAQVNTNASDQCYKRDVFSLLFHQKIQRTLPFTAQKRGLYEITDASVFGFDFLFRPGYFCHFPQDTKLYVYPKQIDTRRINLLYQAITGMILSKNRLHPDPFEFSGIRDYRKEDPIRQINWKASARCGELMVNQYDSTTSASLTILLDLTDALIYKYEDLLEESIRITSSLSHRLVSQKITFDVISNGIIPSTKETLSCHFPAGAGKIADLNQSLSCIDTTAETASIDTLIETELTSGKNGHTYIVISKNKTATQEGKFASLLKNDNSILWVMPMYGSELTTYKNDIYNLPQLTFLPWETTF